MRITFIKPSKGDIVKIINKIDDYKSKVIVRMIGKKQKAKALGISIPMYV